jgi:hypothetical protein
MELTERGITFDVYNVDTRSPSVPIYQYRGLMFQISEHLAFYGEEQNLIEPFSMLTSRAQVPGKSLLCGHFMAITEWNGVRNAVGTRVVLQRRTKRIVDFEQEKQGLGVFPLKQIPVGIRDLI